MEQFFTGVVCGAIALAVIGGKPEPEIVEVLPENYKIVTSISEDVCSSPTGKTTIAHRQVRTQTVDYSN